MHLDRRLCVAPMMDWTDRHCRFFHRLLAPCAVLYTEMVTTAAVLHADPDRLLAFNPEEHPIALQLGGSEPADLARCAQIAAARGFDEINLNVGCPSDRVQSGRFGACLMREPERVRDCVAAMLDAVKIPVSVKTRLGVDDCDSYDYFCEFVQRVAESGCTVFAVHARKAWLSGLSPKQNREIPELRYEWVYRLKREHPQFTVVLNGGIAGVEDMREHLRRVDGVMLGRAAYHDPWTLVRCQQAIAPGWSAPTREEVLAILGDYADRQARECVPVKSIARHVLGLFHGQPGARRWRRHIAACAHRGDADGLLFRHALAAVNDGAVQARNAA